MVNKKFKKQKYDSPVPPYVLYVNLGVITIGLILAALLFRQWENPLVYVFSFVAALVYFGLLKSTLDIVRTKVTSIWAIVLNILMHIVGAGLSVYMILLWLSFMMWAARY